METRCQNRAVTLYVKASILSPVLSPVVETLAVSFPALD